MKKILILSVLSVCCLSIVAQTVVNGNVVDGLSGKNLPGANVVAKHLNGKLIGFSVSDDAGKFSIKINDPVDSVSISSTKLGYKPFSTKRKVDSAPFTIYMEDGSLELEEVVVKADRIRENGDTITYHVSSFAQKQDKTIGDVLKRMPGIDVLNNGKIKYQGVEINKFYIEGNDLLGGKYGVATNGISHSDIGTVEVMEKHMPMQVLRGLSFSDRAAINLKMKNRSKATLLVHGSLAGGWSELPKGTLWQGDIFTMMVTGKYQMITTLKGNNTGVNLSDELIDFTSDRSDERLEGYISLSSPSAPNLARHRSFLNRSWMVSSNHLLKTNKGGEFKAQVDYNHDRVTAQGKNITTYFLETGEKVILEEKNSLSHRQAITGKLSYEVNEKTYFLNNTLSADISWRDLTLNTTGTLANTQTARMPEFSVSNFLKVIKRFGNNKLVTITSRNEWNSLPEKLSVSHGGEKYGEEIKQHSFYTDERASLGFIFNGLHMALEAGVTGYFRNLDIDLWGINNENITGAEELTTDYLRIFAKPKFEWSYKKFGLTLNLPLNFYSYFFSGGLHNRTEFFLSPSLTARFRISPRMSLNLGGSARRSPASLHNIHDASILTNYRTFSAGVDDYYSSSGQSLFASCFLRDTRSGLFLFANVIYGWNKSKFTTVQDIVGNYIFHSYRPQPADSRNKAALINSSKTLDFMRGAIKLNGSYNRLEKKLFAQGVKTDYQSDSYSLSPSINGNIAYILNWTLSFTWNRSVMKASYMDSRSSENFIYSGNVTLTPCPLITWTTGGEFYRNQIESAGYKEMLMLDSKLSFNISKRFEISASVTNILNNKSYSYTTYGTLSQNERSSCLRGREFLLSIYLKK